MCPGNTIQASRTATGTGKAAARPVRHHHPRSASHDCQNLSLPPDCPIGQASAPVYPMTRTATAATDLDFFPIQIYKFQAWEPCPRRIQPSISPSRSPNGLCWGGVDPDAGPQRAAWPEAARATDVGQRIEELVSENGTNSHDMAFETWLSAQFQRRRAARPDASRLHDQRPEGSMGCAQGWWGERARE